MCMLPLWTADSPSIWRFRRQITSGQTPIPLNISPKLQLIAAAGFSSPARVHPDVPNAPQVRILFPKICMPETIDRIDQIDKTLTDWVVTVLGIEDVSLEVRGTVGRVKVLAATWSNSSRSRRHAAARHLRSSSRSSIL